MHLIIKVDNQRKQENREEELVMGDLGEKVWVSGFPGEKWGM